MAVPLFLRRIVLGLAGLVAALLLLAFALLFWLGTDSGRAFVARQISALAFENGMTIGIGRIEGSLFSAMRIRDLTLADPKGVFMSAPQVDLDYRPLAYLGKHVDVRALAIPSARLRRLPAFRETPPSAGPLLPDLDIDVGRLTVGRLEIDPAITGQHHLLSLDGAAHIAGGRARLAANAHALEGAGIAGGDRLVLRLDAVPEANQLAMALSLVAPADGLVASYSGVAQPLVVQLGGKGDWEAWDGTLAGRLGAESLASLSLAARDGRFALTGPVRPGLLLSGPARTLLEPATNIDLRAGLGKRQVQLQASAANDNFRLGTQGLLDLGAGEARNLTLAVRLLRPGAIAETLSGTDILARATVDSAFAAPRIVYTLDARELGFGATRIDGLSVSGRAALEKGQWRIPLTGSARRISGVSESIAPLLADVRLSGDFAYAGGRLLSDNIRVQSRGIDARAIVLADMNRALYTGALNGRVNGYDVASIGRFNIATNVDLKSGANGAFRLAGRVTARSTRWVNDGIRTFLGGNALIVANVGYGSDGVATVDRLSVAAPDFRMAGAHGRYGADGSVRFAGRGHSDAYGPLGVAVSGTVDRPVIRATAARPGMGVGLADVTATITGNQGVYLVRATGGTDYGPLAANVAISTARALAIDLREGTRLAGVGMTGRLMQTPAGPFSGTLRALGAGIDGTVALSAVSGRQRALVDATARNASLPGTVGLSAERAIVKADVVLYDQPQVVADVQIAGTRLGSLTIAGARADVTYRGGRGQAKLLVEGRSHYPFRIAANALLDPKLWRVAMTGRFNGIAVETRAPMHILPERGGYRLEPATLSVDKGSLQIAGHYGSGMALAARLDGVNLALVNPFAPGLGLGGMASGSLDYRQASASAFPTAQARMRIDDFTRTSLALVSEPVDISIDGDLTGERGEMRALIRRRGAAIGRMQAGLTPLPGTAGNWSTRLLAAPLSGGVRYNGPADVLFSLAALPDQSVKGPIGLAADFGGRLSAPQLSGVVRANSLTYENALYGTRLTRMAVRGQFTNDRLDVESLTARAGDGTVSASGFVSLSSAQGFPLQLGIEMDRAQVATGQDLSARASGQLRIVNGAGQPPTISGRISLPETHYRIAYQDRAQVATLTGVRRKPPQGRERISGAAEAGAVRSLPSDWRLEVQVVADNKVYVTGMGLNSEWQADIRMRGTSGAPAITGGVDLVRGTLGFAGHSFELQQGRLRFNGGAMTDPDINIVASGEVEDVTISITITGRGSDPQIAFTSTPALPQDELMARILFGNSVGQLSAIQAVQLAASLNSLRGGSGGLNPLGVLQSSSGIDRIRILGADKESGRGTALAVGQYITNDVYVEIVTDARGYTATQLEIALSKALSLLSQMGSLGGSSVDLRYRKDY